MSSAPTTAEIARDARWLAQALDPSSGMARLIAMDRDSYRAASFLDDRMMRQPMDAQVVPWPDVEAAISGDLRTDARWIFHIGHVGSTLISRLLGELDGVLGIREPRILRDLALSPAEIRRRYIAAIPKLMSRTFAGDEIACLKATSFVSEIAPQLVPPAERALFMYASPANYIASILAGENSLKELRLLAATRAERLARRVPAMDAAQNDAGFAAIAWACEMTALEAAADAMTDRRIEWADFDAMLDEMEESLARTAAFFNFPAEEAQVSAIVRGPLMSRYSKDISYDYSPGLRRDLLAEATAVHRQAIDGALAMLERAAEKSPLLARAIRRSLTGD
jgi:hypothetical protein